jgi:hypothetical protein
MENEEWSMENGKRRVWERTSCFLLLAHSGFCFCSCSVKVFVEFENRK